MTELPEHCVTRQRLRVRFGEVDLMGIVHHAKYLSYFEIGRIEYLRRRGLSYRVLIEKGLHLPVVKVEVSYKKPARYDDELLLETRLTELGRVKVTFGYRLLPAAAFLPEAAAASRSAADPTLVTATTVLACVNHEHAPCRIPEQARELLLCPETLGDDAGPNTI